MPELRVGDWIVYENMGAYTVAGSCKCVGAAGCCCCCVCAALVLPLAVLRARCSSPPHATPTLFPRSPAPYSFNGFDLPGKLYLHADGRVTKTNGRNLVTVPA